MTSSLSGVWARLANTKSVFWKKNLKNKHWSIGSALGRFSVRSLCYSRSPDGFLRATRYHGVMHDLIVKPLPLDRKPIVFVEWLYTQLCIKPWLKPRLRIFKAKKMPNHKLYKNSIPQASRKYNKPCYNDKLQHIYPV